MQNCEKVFMNFDVTDTSHTLEEYKARGGYKAIDKAIKKMKPDEVAAEVKTAGVRGRGGAGFPAGLKWSFVPRDTGKPIYLLCNADEGEPGTFKDRWLLEYAPHQLIEGMILSNYALGVEHSFIYIRGEFDLAHKRICQAVEDAYKAGFLGDNILQSNFSTNIIVHQGAGAYICGEETSLITSLEGKRGLPRNKPPFPAVEGFFACPTVVNNVETLAAVEWIINNGGANYAKMGTEKSTGTKLFSISGHVNKPGVYEVEMGYSFMDFINNEAGGMLNGKKLKAVIPGGSSTPILKPEQIAKTKLDYESIAEHGSMLGSGAIIVIAEGTCMVKLIRILAQFYHHESCGQCTPCREGTGWLERILARIERGEGRSEDIDRLLWVSKNIAGNTICPLGDAAAMPVISFVEQFREEFEYYVENKRSMYGGNVICQK